MKSMRTLELMGLLLSVIGAAMLVFALSKSLGVLAAVSGLMVVTGLFWRFHVRALAQSYTNPDKIDKD